MEQTNKLLKGKAAVVTGAGKGIGKAISLAYAGEGASVACAARTQSDIQNTAKQIEDAGGNAIAIPTDVTCPEAVKSLFAKTADLWGGIDIVVVNAGGNYDREPVETSHPDNWRNTLEVNLFGAYHCAQAAIPLLKQRGGGKIITIGSGLGHRGTAGGSAYACSKAGLWMLTRVLAQELWPYNISVNELIPGPVATSIDDHFPTQKSNVSNIDSEWVKNPQDVVPLALFLAGQPDRGPTVQSFSLMRRDH